jgi:hypothetical protein
MRLSAIQKGFGFHFYLSATNKFWLKETQVKYPTLLLILAVSSLLACTGSLEAGSSPIRLVFSVNPSASVNLACPGSKTALPIAQNPGLVLLDMNQLIGNNPTVACGAVLPLAGVPFQTIGGLESTPSIFVSLPSKGAAPNKTQGAIQRFTYTGTNTLSLKSEFKPSDGSNFCPTAIALNTTYLVALDDPNNQNCVAQNNNTPARILVFNLSNPSNPSIIANTNLFDIPISGNISLSISSSNILYALGAFTNQYRINRFDLTNLTNAPIQSNFLNGVNATSILTDLSIVGGRLLAAFSSNNLNDTTGSVLPLVENTAVTPLTISFGDELRTGDTSSPAIGKTFSIQSNSSDPSSFVLYLRPNNVLFQKNSQFAQSSLSSTNTPLDAIFPPDNSIWLLTTNTLFNTDTRNFPSTAPSLNAIVNLSNLNPGNLVWVLDNNQ